MLKKLMITTAASALVATAAWAQSPNQSQSGSSTPPAATQSQSGSSGSMNQGSANQGSMNQGASKNFVSMQKPDQWLASKFRGIDVVGSDNEKIGDVSDILFDKSGKVEAYVISVGGFLGMGAKDVALPPTAFQVVDADAARGNTTGAGSSGAANNAARNANANDPNNIKLKLAATKDELKNAQAFEPYKAQTTTGSTGTNRPASGGMGGSGGANR